MFLLESSLANVALRHVHCILQQKVRSCDGAFNSERVCLSVKFIKIDGVHVLMHF